MTESKIEPACDDYIGSLVETLDTAEASGFPLQKTKIERKLIARVESDREENASLRAEVAELRAELAAREQAHRDMLQTVGEEATRQLSDKDRRIEDLETELALAVVPDDHEAEERAVLNARIIELDEQVKEYNRLLDISKSYGRKEGEDLVKWITGIMAKESFLN